MKKLLLRFLVALFAAPFIGTPTQAAGVQVESVEQAAPRAASEGGASSMGATGPVRLRQANMPRPVVEPVQSNVADALANYKPSEFERYVQRQLPVGSTARRLGAELLFDGADGRTMELSPAVPQDYLIGPGDELVVSIWGSVDAELHPTVDRDGRIVLPRVGAIPVAGVKLADLQSVIARRVAGVFKNFELSVGLGQLRGMRILVTGYVQRPGAHPVNSLATVVSGLLAAGGPIGSGSFRNIELRRAGKSFVTFDLYDLLLKGDRSADVPLQAGDVIHVPAVGPEVGVVGSVNRPCIVELKPGETLGDAVRMAGGLSAVAEQSRIIIERLQDRSTTRVRQIDMPGGSGLLLERGDILRAVSAVDAALPTQRQNKRVRVEGEVANPSDFILPEGSTIQDAIRAAGGVTPSAFLFATEFSRESVRLSQQVNFERALRDLETDIARSNTEQRRQTSAEDLALNEQRQREGSRLLERLRQLKPTGRIVLQMDIAKPELPDLVLEDGDRLYIPALPTTVGVFGSVFNAANYLYTQNRPLEDYLRLAGGPTKGADDASIFVIRANGTVISSRQDRSWFSGNASLKQATALPGDTLFVPEETNKVSFVQFAKDWTQILYQFGLGVAGMVTIFK